jgi:hypothetical protein
LIFRFVSLFKPLLRPRGSIPFVPSCLRAFVPASVPLQSPFPGQSGKELGRGQILRAEFMRVLVAQFVETERAALRDLDGARDQLRARGVTPGDLVPRTQMALGVGQQARARLGERALLADARQHVLQVTPLRDVVVHVVRRDEGDAGASRQLGELREAHFVGHVIGQLGGEIQLVAEDFAVGIERGTKARRHGGTEGLGIGDCGLGTGGLRFAI